MKHLLLFLCTALALTACRHSEEEESGPAQRTVIVYVAAENNLSSFTRSDLNEMTRGSALLNKRQKLVAFIDDAETAHPYIVEMKEGRRDTVLTYDEDFYSSDPERFREVIATIEERFPAESYGLVLWGHAKGWIVEDSIAQSRHRKAYGVDTGSNLAVEHSFKNRWMNITQMARALETLPQLRFIFADCCCMMCAEVAYELRNTADYLIGSPAEIPGSGAPYEKILPMLYSTADDFYRQIIDAYYDYYLDAKYSGCSLPLSVVDMSQMEELAAATRMVLREPSDYVTDQIAYYYRNKNDLPLMFDMCSIMERNLDDNNYREWKAALDKAVPYRRFSERWITDMDNFDVYKGFSTSIFTEDNYGGLSMFVPKPEYNFSPFFDFNNDIRKFGWFYAVDWGRFF